MVLFGDRERPYGVDELHGLNQRAQPLLGVGRSPDFIGQFAELIDVDGI